MQLRKPPLPALTVKLSKYNVDDVALGFCKTGAEEAGVTEVRTSLSEKKFELWREIKVLNMIKLLSRKPTALRLVNPSAAKIKIFTAEGLTKRSAVGFLLRSLIMFQTFISRHNSNFFSDKLVLTSVTPASSAPVLQTPKATSSTLYFDSLTVNAGNGGFLHCIQMDTSVNAANQVVSVGADIAFDADPKFFACLVRFESSSVPTTLPTAYDVYPLDGRHDRGYYTVKDCVTIDVLPRTPGNNVYVGFMVWSNFTATKCRGLVSLNQVIKEIICLQPLK